MRECNEQHIFSIYFFLKTMYLLYTNFDLNSFFIIMCIKILRQHNQKMFYEIFYEIYFIIYVKLC